MMPNPVKLNNSLLISYLFSTFSPRLHIDHSLDYPTNNMQHVFAFITERYIASKLMFPVMTVTLTYLVVVIIVREFQHVISGLRLRAKYRFFCVKIDLKYQSGP